VGQDPIPRMRDCWYRYLPYSKSEACFGVLPDVRGTLFCAFRNQINLHMTNNQQTSFPLPRAASRTAGNDSFHGTARPKRILFIDDNIDVRDICGELLRRTGYCVDFAADGETGWEILSAAPYDLLITDHNMPRLSGLNLVRRLRAASQNLPVIMVSGNLPWDEPDLQWMLRPGAILQKPFSFADLLAKVEDLTYAGRAEIDAEADGASLSRAMTFDLAAG
jgi:CheY-like chemotaxis protein